MPSFAPQRRVAAAVLLGLAVVTCTRDLDAPRIPARLELAPHFMTGSTPPGNALAVNQVRAQVVRHSTAEVVVDKTYPFASGSSLQLSISFSLTQPTDTFDVFLDYEHGSETLFSGSQSVVVTGGATPAPIPLPVGYVGPGKSATSMTIGPRDTVLTSGDPLQLRLTVLDTATPDSLYVGWGTNSGSVTVDATGHLVASITRGTVTVRAISPAPPGLSDSTTVRIVPKPAAMVKVSGDGQTGVASQPLPLPLVVQVNGSDNLGVPGVTVTFAALSGGTVDSAQVVTDSLGRASTGVTLGPSTTAQSFSATAGTLSVTFGATGSAVPPKTWTGAVSTDWNTAGNWSPAGVPGATDSVIVPPGTANSAVIRGGLSYSVNGLFIQSGATVTMDTATLLVNGSFTQAGVFTDPSVSSNLTLQGSGKTVVGSMPILSTVVVGNYTLSGDVQGASVQVLGRLDLGGHALTASTAFGTGGTGVLVMNANPDTLLSPGTTSFNGGNTSGDLNLGYMILGGNVVVSAPSALQCAAGVTIVFNGSAVQTVAIVDSNATNTLGTVDFRNTAGVQLSELMSTTGDVSLEANAVVTSPDTSVGGQGLVVAGVFASSAGSRIHVGRMYLHGTLFGLAPASWAVTATYMVGAGQTVAPGTYSYLYTQGAGTQMAPGDTVLNMLAIQGGDVSLQGDVTTLANVTVQNGALLHLNGHLFKATAFTTTQGGLVQLQAPSDSLVVTGNASFGGGVETGQLTSGTFVLGGNFAATATSAFDAGPSMLTVFNGVATQTISVFDTTHSNQFGSVEFRNTSGGVLFDQLTGVNGNARVDTSAIVKSTDTTLTGGGMAMNGGLTTFPASLLKLGELWVNTTFSYGGGTYAVTSTIFTGNGQTVPAGVPFQFLYSNGPNVSLPAGVVVATQLAVQGGTLTLTGNFSYSGNTYVEFNSKLVLNGHTFSGGGQFTTSQGGLLQMTNTLDTLVVGGNAFFEGGNESGLLTAGGIIFQKNFTEVSGDAQAFAPSGTHVDEFLSGGGAQIISFAHPGGTGASHFQGLAISNGQGTLQIASDVYLLGGYAYLAGSPKIVHGSGQVVHYANLTITGVTFDNVSIAYDAALGGNNLIALDSVTFENYSVNSATALITIVSPGNTGSPGTPFLFSNLSFLTSITANGGSGFYLSVTNTGAVGALILDVTANLPAGEGLAHTGTAGSPTITWP